VYRDWIKGVLLRDLRCLRRQVEAYADERDLWKTPPGVSNSAGNLALHLAGNIQHFIGTTLGGSGYKRDRDAEFAGRNVPRAELLRAIDAALAAVEETMPRVTDEQMDQPAGIRMGDATFTTGDFVMHLVSHFGYHLGQIDYHRRMVTGEAGKLGAVNPMELGTAKTVEALKR